MHRWAPMDPCVFLTSVGKSHVHVSSSSYDMCVFLTSVASNIQQSSMRARLLLTPHRCCGWRGISRYLYTHTTHNTQKHTHTHTHICLSIYIYIYTHTQTHTHTHTHTTHTHTQIYMFKYVYIYTHTHRTPIIWQHLSWTAVPSSFSTSGYHPFRWPSYTDMTRSLLTHTKSLLTHSRSLLTHAIHSGGRVTRAWPGLGFRV